MLSPEMHKSKSQNLLPPMGTLSQHQTLVLTDVTEMKPLKDMQQHTGYLYQTKVSVPNEERLFFSSQTCHFLCGGVISFFPAHKLILKLIWFPWYHG